MPSNKRCIGQGGRTIRKLLERRNVAEKQRINVLSLCQKQLKSRTSAQKVKCHRERKNNQQAAGCPCTRPTGSEFWTRENQSPPELGRGPHKRLLWGLGTDWERGMGVKWTEVHSAHLQSERRVKKKECEGGGGKKEEREHSHRGEKRHQ